MRVVGVTPYVGVWIETRGCRIRHRLCYVTPYVGVWIETRSRQDNGRLESVTPYVGVWIETFCGRHALYRPGSLLMWECGLKQ